MAKAPKRKPKVTKIERRTILKAAAKRKPKADKADKADKPKSASWKASRKKRKPEPIPRETIPTIRKARGPDLKPRKKRSDAMATKKLEGEDEDNGDDVKDAKDKDDKGDPKGAKGATYNPVLSAAPTYPAADHRATSKTVPEGYVEVYDSSSGQTKMMKAP